MPARDPAVSVVIPCYDNCRTIGLAAHSAMGQSYAPTEVIVVDDASTDGSAQVAASVGATVVSTEVNCGPAAARNLGAAYASGDVLFFLDGDTALEPGGIAAAVALLQSSHHVGAVCGICLPGSLRTDNLVARYRAQQLYHWWLAREGTIPDLHTAVFAMWATVFHEIGPFHPALRHTEAPEYGRRLRQRYEIHSTAALAGRHDHDDTLRVLLPKVFRRAWASALEWGDGEVPGGSPARVLASGLVLASVPALALPAIAAPLTAVVAPLSLAAAVALDADTYRRVLAREGPGFTCAFVGLHLLYNLTSAVGAAAGFAHRALRPRGRPSRAPNRAHTDAVDPTMAGGD